MGPIGPFIPYRIRFHLLRENEFLNIEIIWRVNIQNDEVVHLTNSIHRGGIIIPKSDHISFCGFRIKSYDIQTKRYIEDFETEKKICENCQKEYLVQNLTEVD